MEDPNAPVFSAISPALLSTTIIFVVIATIAVGIRIWLALQSTAVSKLTSDHWLIIAALMFCYAFMIQTICAAAIGGVYTSRLPQLEATVFFDKILWMDMFFFQPASSLVKISILQFYKRIFPIPRLHIVCDIEIVFIVIWCISSLFGQLFACNPIDSCWSPTLPGLRFDFATFALAIFGAGIVLDVITLCLPVPVINSLHMKTGRKFKVTSIFFLGIFCVVAASIRFYYAYIGNRAADSSFTNGYPYATVATEAMWSRIEPSASVIAACLPLFGPIVPHGRRLGSMVRSAIEMISIGSSRGSRRSRKSDKSHDSKTKTTQPTQSTEHLPINKHHWQQLSESRSKNSNELNELRSKATANYDNALVHDDSIHVTREVELKYTAP